MTFARGIVKTLSLLLSVYPLAARSAWTGDSVCSDLVCLNATMQGDTLNFQVTDMHTDDKDELGYIGIGFGKHMARSYMFILWPTSNGTVTLSQRYAMSHTEPQPVKRAPSIASVIDPISTSWLTDNRTTMSFTVPASERYFKNSSSVPMIWAYGRNKPTPEEDPNATLWFHYQVGHWTLDLTKDLNQTQLSTPSGATSETQSSSSGSSLAAFHGFLLSIGFMVILPLGSLVGRYARSFTPRWFPVHQMAQMWVAGPFILFGWVLGPVSVSKRGSEHFMDTHQTFGFALLALYCGQAWLGRYIHQRRVDGLVKVPHPPLNIFHVALGLSILVLAFVQIRTGITKYEFITASEASWRRLVFNAFAVLLPVLYIAGLLLLPRQFKKERETTSSAPPPAHYTPLSTGDEEPLLYTIGTDQDDDEIKPERQT